MIMKRFPGGIHPKYNKELTAAKPIIEMPPPKKVRLLLRQHLGAPCTPLVAAGDKVTVGQKIADTDAFVAAPVIASVSGEVTAVDSEGIDIACDSTNSDFKGQKQQYSSPEQLRQLIREAGIVGMGGATFPTHVKLTPPEGKSISTLIINGAECEPFLTTDHRLMLEQGEDVIQGTKLLMEACGAGNAVIGIEANKPDAIKHLTDICQEHDNISVVAVPVRYPQGGERQLIKTLTGKEVPVGGLPLDLGFVVSNVATAAAVHHAVNLGRPLIDRVVTVSGAVAKPGNVRVRLGTSIADLIDFCGGLDPDVIKVICGGPMMGQAVDDLNSPVTKGTSGVLAFTAGDVREYEERTCISCASCVDACPQKLLPNYLARYSKKGKLDLAEQYHLFNCIECGCCSYVCPSRIPIVKYIKTAKDRIQRRRRK